MTLVIATLTWNALGKLERLKNSLLPSLNKLDEWRWIIKDNGSLDGTYETASKWHKNIEVIPYKDNNQNYSEGMNYIFNYAKPSDNDLFLFLNNDVIFGDDVSLNKMINLLSSDVGIVGAKLLYTGTNKIQCYGVVFNSRGLPFNYMRQQEDTEYSRQDRYFQATTGAVMLMRSVDYKKFMMCEGLRWAFDDVDMSLNISKVLKKKVICCGGTKIFHDESSSLKINPVNILHMQYNVNYFLSKWRSKIDSDLTIYSNNKDYNLCKKS